MGMPNQYIANMDKRQGINPVVIPGWQYPQATVPPTPNTIAAALGAFVTSKASDQRPQIRGNEP